MVDFKYGRVVVLTVGYWRFCRIVGISENDALEGGRDLKSSERSDSSDARMFPILTKLNCAEN